MQRWFEWERTRQNGYFLVWIFLTSWCQFSYMNHSLGLTLPTGTCCCLILRVARSDRSYFLCRCFSMGRAWVGWVVYVCFSMSWYFCFWPGMVLNQRQLSIVVPDWDPYLGSLFSRLMCGWFFSVLCFVYSPYRTVSFRSCYLVFCVHDNTLSIWTLTMLCIGTPLLLPPTMAVTLSFVSPEIPKDWKAAAVIPLFKGGTLLAQTATDLYLSYPAFLRSSKAKSTNRLPTISNLTIPSLLCNLVSELVMGAPQPRSRS